MTNLTQVIFVFLALLGGASFSFAQVEQKPKSVFEDVLVMRLQSKNLFLSDLKTYAQSVKTFQCLYPQAQILKLTKANQDQLQKLLSLKSQEVSENAELITVFRRLLSIQILNNAQNFSVAADFDLSLKRSSCGVGRFSTWDNELKSLVQAELVMRQSLEQMNEAEKKSFQSSFEQTVDQAINFENYL